MILHRPSLTQTSHSLRVASFVVAYATAMALGTALLIAGLN